MSARVIETLANAQALSEVRSLKVWDLHELPLAFTLVFVDVKGNAVRWTTDKVVHQTTPGALSPMQYTVGVPPGVTVAESEAKLRLVLQAVEVVNEPRKETHVPNG